MLPIIGDHKQPQLSKTEKAVSMLQTEIDMLKGWNAGLQRQIAGFLISLKVTPDKFCINTRNPDINKFLEEAQAIEDQIMKSDQAKQDEQIKKMEEFKPKEDGNPTTEKIS